MGLMQKLGGRKFLMALACIGVAIVMELKGPKGLSVEMAGFMTAIVGLFSAANTAATKHYLQSEDPGPDKGLERKLNEIHQTVNAGMSPEAVQGFTDLLLNLNKGMNDVKLATAQVLSQRK